MLRGRTALASVFLSFVCLLIQKPHPIAQQCSPDMVQRVVSFTTKVKEKTWLETRLYTPDIQDYKNCPSAVLKCFSVEIKVLTEEWESSGEKMPPFKLVRKLEILASFFNQTESNCRQCEFFNEENVEAFLSGLLSTIEYMNSQFCKTNDPS